MNALFYLSFKKTWGIIRGWFKRPVSAILTVIAIFLLGGALVGLAFEGSAGNNVEFSIISSIVVALYVAIFVFSLISKNKALVFQNDASFVLSGPFSKKQVLGYLLMNVLLQNIWITVGFSAYILIFFRSAIGNLSNFLVLFGSMFVFSASVLVFTSYDYILEKTFYKYQMIKKIIVTLFVGGFFGIGFLTVMNQPLSFAMLTSIQSNEMLHVYPLFGWFMAMMFHGYEGSVLLMMFYGSLIAFVGMIAGYLFFNTKLDFYEAAIQDSERVQVIVDKAKSGNSADLLMMNATIKEKQGVFRPGAWAIWSSFVLQMRKSNQFIRIGDLIFFLMYTVIAYFTGSLETYRFMLSLVVFISINNETIIYELKRPYVYLIPEKAFKKLAILILPMVYRMVIVTILGGIASMFVFHQNIVQAVFFVLSLWGIALILISGSVLTLKLLKGSKNPFVEQLLRLLVIVIAMLPSIVVMVVITFTAIPFTDPSWPIVFSMVVLLINGAFAVLIIKLSSSMLLGNDMFV